MMPPVDANNEQQVENGDRNEPQQPPPSSSEASAAAAAAADSNNPHSITPSLFQTHPTKVMVILLFLVMIGVLLAVQVYLTLQLQIHVQRKQQSAAYKIKHDRPAHTVLDSTPLKILDLHQVRLRNLQNQIYWNRAAAVLQEWDPTIHGNDLAGGAGAPLVVNASQGLHALVRAAEEGHGDALYVLGNAYSSGIWPAGEAGLWSQSTTNTNLPPLHVQETWIDPDSTQQTQAQLYWHMAALAGNGQAASVLAYRMSLSHAKCSDDTTLLPYYEAAASAILDQLHTSEFRGKAVPAMDKHLLYQLHYFGTHSKLEAHNKPDESAQALQFYHHKAVDKNPSAAQMLANLYHHGSRGVEQNMTLALKYYSMAAKQSHWESAGQAGDLYLWGMGVDSDPYQAHRFYALGMPYGLEGCRRQLDLKLKRKEVSLCDPASLNGIGVLSLLGLPLIIGIDPVKAEGFFHLAKEQGNKDAAYNLAMMKLGWKTHYRPIDYNDKEGQSKADEDFLDQLPLNHLTQSEWQSILTDLTTAAGGNHVQAKFRLAQMYSKGVSIPYKGTKLQVVPKDCDKALKHYKWIVENASIHRAQRLKRAYKQYLAGDTAASLRNYLAVAEMGSEQAQLNAAFLLEQGECLGMDPIDCAKASVRLWKECANKGHGEASLRVGDFYYYGKFRGQNQAVVGPLGWTQYLLYPEKFVPKLLSYIEQRFWAFMDVGDDGEEQSEQIVAQTCASDLQEGSCPANLSPLPLKHETEHSLQTDLAMAAQYYRMAAEKAASSRANFNLGYLYEWGLGVKQDFPLAKRHYDLAASGNAHEAELPVMIALFCLSWHEKLMKMWMSLDDWMNEDYTKEDAEKGENRGDGSTGIASDGQSVPSVADGKSIGGPVPTSRRERRSKKDVILTHLMSWETLAILGLTFVLSMLLRHRRTGR